MSIEVVMPQMGESITEGTVSKWLKNVGDRIEKDEAVLEISTDKVDAEVPSPGAGTILEIRYQEGDTVEVGTVLAVIGAEGEKAAVSSKQSAVSNGPTSVEIQQSAAEIQPSSAKAIAAATAPIEGPGSKPAEAVIPTNGQGTDVVMPQMGESITEGTVSKWLKQVGDSVQKDEPLLEISTDKVDAEVPSPAAGTLTQIRVQEGETVEVGSVLAVVGAGFGTPAPATKPKAEVPAAKVEAPKPAEAAKLETPTPQPIAKPVPTNGGGDGAKTVEELRRSKSSPLVRSIARKHGIDITRIPGSGLSGRVTKKDILSFIETGAALRPEDLLKPGALPVETPVKQTLPVAAPEVTPKPVETTPVAETPKPEARKPAYQPAAVDVMPGDRIEKMSVMRKKIAEHMTFSKQTSAHVTSVYEIDMTNVARTRDRNKDSFQQKYGTKLTFMPFIFEAVTNAITQYRIVNSQVSGDEIIYKGDVNLGMAVALDWGLIVPVIRNADTLTLAELAVKANDLADRARTKRLDPNEVMGGTFTITNPGVFGGLFGTPIINQPQVAILCVGAIEKRPKVVATVDGDDALVIRHMAYFALTYDHRVVDGADAEKFLSHLKKYLEETEFQV